MAFRERRAKGLRVAGAMCALLLAIWAARPARAQSSENGRELATAIAAFQRSDLDTARHLVQAYLKQHPGSAAAWNLKGLIDDSQKDFEAGGKDFETALRLAPSASVYTNLGNHYLLAHESARAQQAFKAALRLEPRHFSARFDLLNLVLSEPPCQPPDTAAQNSTARASAPFSSWGPTAPVGRSGTGSPACAQEALHLIKGFSAADLARPEVVALKVRALLAAGERPAAVQTADAALARSPGDPKLAYSVGIETAQWGEARDAVPFLERARSLLPAHQPDPHLLFALGQAKFAAGLPASAEFLQLKEIRPDWWQPYYYLGRIADQGRQYIQASTFLVKAQQLAPREPLIAAALANVAAEQGFWFDAADEWQRHIRLQPGDLRAYRELAIVAGVAHQQELAISSMERYLKAYPQDANAYYMLALMDQDGGQRQQALQALHQCLSLNPRLAPAWTTLGQEQMDRGDSAAAKESLHRALQIDPRYAPAQVALAEVNNHEGHPELALPLLEEAVKNDPNNIAGYYQLALVERRTGHPQEANQAAATFERLRGLNPRNPSGRGLLAYLREDIKLTPAERQRHYLEFLENALKARPTDPRLLCRLGVAELAGGEKSSGLAHIEQSLKPDLPYEDALATAQALSSNGQGELALRFYQLAVTLPAATRDARAALGEARLLLALGRPREAVEMLESVPAGAAPKGEAADLAALVFARLGMDPQALAAFRVAVALGPSGETFYRDEAIFLGSRGQWTEALAVLDEAKKQCGPSHSLTLDEAVLLQLSGRRNQAQALLKGLAFQADDPALTSRQRLAALLLGISYYTTDQKDKAGKIFEQLTRSDPELVLAWYYRALLAFESGRRAKAGQWVSRSLAIAGRYPPALYLEGELQMDAGNLAKAQSDFEAAAAADPAWSSPHYQLSRLFQRLGKSELAKKEASLVAQLNARAQGSQSGELREYLDGLTFAAGH